MPATTRWCVAFQGERGAFSEEAVTRLWPEAEPVPMRENLDVARAVEGGVVDAGVLPVENTLAGSVAATYDAIAACPGLVATGEVVLGIHHCVLGIRGATLAGVRRVESHPVALAQCGEFLRRHPEIEARAAYDTAGAARAVAAAGDATRAAIAGRAAAAHYGLAILAADVEDRPDNQTRFVALARAAASPPPGVPARTILLLETANSPGSLHRALGPIAERGLNLSKIESRPTGEPWRYRFTLEVEHAAGDPALAAAVESIRAVARACRVVGTYALDAARLMAESREPRAEPRV